MDEVAALIRGNACCLVAGIGFAVNYLPVKKCDTGDGIFFCAAMSVGILAVGLLTGMFLTSPLVRKRQPESCSDQILVSSELETPDFTEISQPLILSIDHHCWLVCLERILDHAALPLRVKA